MYDGSFGGWSDRVEPEGVTLEDGTLAPGATYTFTLEVRMTVAHRPATAWSIQASDDSGGSEPRACGGAQTLINGHPDNSGDGQGVTDVAVTDVTQTSATVTWLSENPYSSIVYFGTSSNYTQISGYDSAPVTSHSVDLTGLQPGTNYHFQVAGIDDEYESVYSGDGSFQTQAGAVVAPGGGTGSTGGGPSPAGSPVAVPVPIEVTPPVVAIATTLDKAYRDAPKIQGTASDNVGIATVEFSVDGGKNWSVAQVTETARTTGTGRRKTTSTTRANVRFGFVPVLVEDGNYALAVRATDTSGNRTMSPVITLVIDRLPPRMASGLVALGSQVVAQDAAGRWPAVAGVEQAISMSAVGGPTSVKLQATRAGAGSNSRSFQLHRNARTGLWTGSVQFETAGEYDVRVEAVDGAGNRTITAAPGFVVTPAARVVDAQNQTVKGAKVTLYYREPLSREWVVWDGSAFGQTNPQAVGADGTFRLLVPPGTYYLRAEAPGYRTLVSGQFEAHRSMPVVPSLRLKTRPTLKLGPLSLVLPWVTLGRTNLELGDNTTSKMAADLIGKAMPAPNYPTTRGATSTVGLVGKPSVVTVLSTWSPVMSEQLPALATLQPDKRFNVVPLVMGERLNRVRAYLERARYTLSVTVDEQAVLSAKLGTLGAPTHYLVDSRGVVRDIVTGVLSEAELAAALERLAEVN